MTKTKSNGAATGDGNQEGQRKDGPAKKAMKTKRNNSVDNLMVALMMTCKISDPGAEMETSTREQQEFQATLLQFGSRVVKLTVKLVAIFKAAVPFLNGIFSERELEVAAVIRRICFSQDWQPSTFVMNGRAEAMKSFLMSSTRWFVVEKVAVYVKDIAALAVLQRKMSLRTGQSEVIKAAFLENWDPKPLLDAGVSEQLGEGLQAAILRTIWNNMLDWDFFNGNDSDEDAHRCRMAGSILDEMHSHNGKQIAAWMATFAGQVEEHFRLSVENLAGVNLKMLSYKNWP